MYLRHFWRKTTVLKTAWRKDRTLQHARVRRLVENRRWTMDSERRYRSQRQIAADRLRSSSRSPRSTRHRRRPPSRACDVPRAWTASFRPASFRSFASPAATHHHNLAAPGPTVDRRSLALSPTSRPSSTRNPTPRSRHLHRRRHTALMTDELLLLSGLENWFE